jgi:hypothetical protein
MKAYLFIETGENRNPRVGEWYYDRTHQIMQSKQNFQFVPAPILIRHEMEIEIPQDTDRIRFCFSKEAMAKFLFDIPIPQPKKVKKWQYITINSDRFGRKRGEVTGWLTEREAKERGLEPEDRIYQTEIEVEE